MIWPTPDSMRERVMLTSPAWLTSRSSSGARTRTADWASTWARSTGFAGAAPPLAAKRDQSISGSSAAAPGLATTGAAAAGFDDAASAGAATGAAGAALSRPFPDFLPSASTGAACTAGDGALAGTTGAATGGATATAGAGAAGTGATGVGATGSGAITAATASA